MCVRDKNAVLVSKRDLFQKQLKILNSSKLSLIYVCIYLFVCLFVCLCIYLLGETITVLFIILIRFIFFILINFSHLVVYYYYYYYYYYYINSFYSFLFKFFVLVILGYQVKLNENYKPFLWQNNLFPFIELIINIFTYAIIQYVIKIIKTYTFAV